MQWIYVYVKKCIMYSLDMEKIRSLLSSMYGVNIEVSTMLNNDEEE